MDKISERLKLIRESLQLSQGEFANKLGIHQQQLSKYEKGLNKPSTEFYNKLCSLIDIDLNWLLTGKDNMIKSKPFESESKYDTVFIPYWEGCPICIEKLKKPSIDEGFSVSSEIVVKEWGCNPKNVRLIATPGEEMDGGQYPIRNKDLLVIDISKTDISDSGIYLITTNENKIVMLRRLMELADGSVAFYIDNKEYSLAANKVYTPEEIKAMDFKVVGRVIKNVTYAF